MVLKSGIVLQADVVIAGIGNEASFFPSVAMYIFKEMHITAISILL